MSTQLQKSAIALAIIMLLASAAFAQTWLWPMAGHKAGENIISQPDSHVGKEFNCCDLYIGGDEGDIVICPADGTIINADITYYHSRDASESFFTDPEKTWDENLCEIKVKDNINRQYLSGHISIRIADGRKIHITGLRGEYKFKDGQKISAGDTIGRLAYSYKSIHKPSLRIEVSTAQSTSDDPMTPFGLESRFHLKKLQREDPISVENLRKDLTLLENAILELYPSLNEVMSDEEFHNGMEALRQSVTEPVFPRLNIPLLSFPSLLHDSHLAMLRDNFEVKQLDFYTPVFYNSWCNDTMWVMVTTKGFEQYAGRVIKSIDGVTASDYAKQVYKYIDLYDLDVQSHKEETCVELGMFNVILNRNATADTKSHIVFDDGEEIDIPYCKHPGKFITEGTKLHKMLQWQYINTMIFSDSVYTTRHLNDSTDYLSIRTFDLYDLHLEQVLQWIGECKAPNMIIDLRNNDGGDVYVLNKLLACFAQQPMNRQRGGYLYVKKQGNFETLRYSENHSNDEIIFPKYKQHEGKPGYYCFDSTLTSSCIMPDSSHQYTGRVYVLTNGNSLSAATIFPAVLVRNRRGVSVGRETGSSYHFITAMEFADIRLPSSLRVIRIPMVKVVFDTTVCERTPLGRGLLPDYELPLSYNEITMGADGETDVMLEYALQLIADGKYLSDNDPFAEVDAPKDNEVSNTCNCPWWIWFLIALGIIACIAIAFRHCVKKTHKR